MPREFVDAIEAGLPELHSDDRSHLRDALVEWYNSQAAEGGLPPIELAIAELRTRLGLPAAVPIIDAPGGVDEPDEPDEVDEPDDPVPAMDAGASDPVSEADPTARRFEPKNPRNMLFAGAGLVALGLGASWWNSTPGFALDAMSVDSDSIEVIWVDSQFPSRVVRCSPGELVVTARITADGGATIDNVVLPYLDDEWLANGSVRRIVAEATPVGSDTARPIEGYRIGGEGNTDHDIRLVYAIEDCAQIDQMPGSSSLNVTYQFHGRERESAIALPERLAFIDEDCLAEAIASGDCPAD
ncbi:MAG: hypothetical protein R2706_00550 [Acidimicrobiales bacterium]